MNNAPHDREDPAEERRSLHTRRDRYEEDEDEEEPPRDTFFRDLVRFSLISIALVVPLRMFVAQPFIVQGSSMDPTFESGNYLIVDQVSYHLNEPERGDVIIFQYPEQPSKFFIKRIVGLPSETVTLDEGEVSIRNDEHPNGFVLDDSFVTHPSGETQTVKLASDEYFVLGDNRSSSSDSRMWGALNEKYIIGRAFLRLFPPGQLDYLPGARDLTDQQ